MPNNKTNTDPDLYGRLQEKENEEPLELKKILSADTSSLEKEVFLEREQGQGTTKQTFIPRPPRFYISSSDSSEENIDNKVTHRRYTF